MNSNSGIAAKIDFTALSFLTVVSLSLAMLAYSFGGVDFGVYYAAGRVFLRGGNPYDYSQLVREVVSFTGQVNNPYYYAPWFTWGMALLAVLPYEIARILWAVLNFVFWFWGLFNLSKLIPWPPIGWRRWGMYLLVTFVFAWAAWGSEQVGVLVFLLLTFVILSLERGQWVSGGIWMALLLFKPNITAFPVMALSAWLLIRRRWKPVAGMAGLLVLMLAASHLISPGWYFDLLQPDKITGLSYTLNEAGEIQVRRITTTLPDWLSAIGIAGNTAKVIYVIAGLGGGLAAILMVNKAPSAVRLMASAILVNFALVPYTLFYDYPPVVIPLFIINSNLAGRPGMGWLQTLMNGLVVYSLFAGDNIAHRYWIVVILSCFILFGTTFDVFGAKRHD